MGNAQARSKALVGGMKRTADEADLAELRRQKHAEYMKRQQMMCAICHEPIKEGQPTLTCHKNSDRPHVFHEECLHGWLRMNNHNNNRCPTCNTPCMTSEEYVQRYPVLAPQPQTNDTLLNEHAFDYTEDELDVNDELYPYYVTYWADLHPNATAQGWGWKKVECVHCEKFQWFLTNQNFDDDFIKGEWMRKEGNLACEACWEESITLECVMCNKEETYFGVDEDNVYEVATDFTKLPFPDASLCNQCDLKDKNQVIQALNNKNRVLQYATTLQNDRDVVMTAVKVNGVDLKYASERLKADKSVVQAALKNNGFALNSASKELQGDSKLVYIAMDELSDSFGSILTNYFTYTKDDFSTQKALALHAVGLDGLSLRNVIKIDNFKNDIDVIRTAINQNYQALYSVPTQVLRDNTGLILHALDNVKNKDYYRIFLIRTVREVVLENKSLLLKALSLVDPRDIFDNTAFNVWERKWKDDKEVVLAVVSEQPTFLEMASERLKADKDVVTAAIKKNAKAFQFASKEIKGSKTYALAAIESAPSDLNFSHVYRNIWGEYKENTKDKKGEQREVLLHAIPYFILEFWANRHDLIQSLKLTVEEAKAMIQINPKIYQYLEEDLQAHDDVFLAAYNHENIDTEFQLEVKKIADKLHDVNQPSDDELDVAPKINW